jgi:hypothetical protein
VVPYQVSGICGAILGKARVFLQYGNIKSTKNHMKTKQLSANAKVIVDWLEGQNYKLHNKPGIETHYPRGPKKSPTVIDLCFSRGEISNSIDTWMINHDSTSDYSIIGIRIIRQR